VADAKKVRYDRAGAIALARQAERVVVAKGKKMVVLDLKAEPIDDDALAGYLLGPTGNLKAPALRVGKTLYVGFNEEAYAELMA
jgi:arsenate reductase-like glutaredoxin family protein